MLTHGSLPRQLLFYVGTTKVLQLCHTSLPHLPLKGFPSSGDRFPSQRSVFLHNGTPFSLFLLLTVARGTCRNAQDCCFSIIVVPPLLLAARCLESWFPEMAEIF